MIFFLFFFLQFLLKVPVFSKFHPGISSSPNFPRSKLSFNEWKNYLFTVSSLNNLLTTHSCTVGWEIWIPLFKMPVNMLSAHLFTKIEMQSNFSMTKTSHHMAQCYHKCSGHFYGQNWPAPYAISCKQTCTNGLNCINHRGKPIRWAEQMS